MSMKTINGMEIDWCLCHPQEGQGELPEGNPRLGFCESCVVTGRASLYMAMLEVQYRLDILGRQEG